MERAKEQEEAWSLEGTSEGKRAATKASEENKENLLVNSELQDDLLLYQDEEVLNDSIISGEQGIAGSSPLRSCHLAGPVSSCHHDQLTLGFQDSTAHVPQSSNTVTVLHKFLSSH